MESPESASMSTLDQRRTKENLPTTICCPVMDVFFAKVTNILAQSSRSV
jgi:hypothetical protein